MRNPDVAGVHNENDFGMLNSALAETIPTYYFQLSGSNPAKSRGFFLSETVLIILFRVQF